MNVQSLSCSGIQFANKMTFQKNYFTDGYVIGPMDELVMGQPRTKLFIITCIPK